MRTAAPTLRPILLAWLGLLALTLVTSLLGLLNLGAFNIVVSVFFAAVQAFLIAGLLMHALHGQALVRVVIAGGIIWFLILVTLTSTDYLTRGWLLPSGK
jgi:cytochrome c oxidase subunit IV